MEVHQKLRDKFDTMSIPVPADADHLCEYSIIVLSLNQITFNELKFFMKLGIARMAFLGPSRSRRASASRIVSRD